MSQPPTPAKRGPWPWILGGCGCLTLLGLAGIVGCTALVAAPPADDPGGGADTDQAADSGSGQDAETEDAHAVGDTFEHGNFEFTIDGIERGVAEVTDEFGMSHQPRGSYAVVTMTAANVSSEAQYLEGGNQLLMDDDGNQYEYDVTATTDASFLDQVNPGQSAEADIVFDIPEEAAITHMMVNGKTMVDSGVRVDLPEEG